MTFSTDPAAKRVEKVWSDFPVRRAPSKSAENRGVSLRFSLFRFTGRKGHDCYTPQAFASGLDVIRTTYYYHY
jgi:hypothetical protein